MRFAEAKDAKEIADLLNSAYRGEGSKVGWTTEADLVDGLRTTQEEVQTLISTPQNYFILMGDSRISACVFVKIENLQTLYFGMLAVRPELQAKGVGKELLKHIEAFARKKGLSRIRLSVINLRDELIAFYIRQGFCLTGNEEAFPLPDLVKVGGITLLEMEKKLSD